MFSYNNQFYEQTSGAASSFMSSPFSLVIANIFMKHFEKEVLRNSALRTQKTRSPQNTQKTRSLVPLCRWHIRDIETRQSIELCKFLIFLNNQHPNIHFTIDIEKNAKFPFLDVLVSKKADDILDHQVYRKSTYTDRYLQSHTNTQHKNSLQSIHLYFTCIELSPSLTKNIYRTQSFKNNLTEKQTWQKRHNQNN